VTDRPEPADRRSGPRRFAGVKAMVTHDRLGLTKCKLRDISLDGAFIETGTGTGTADSRQKSPE
jgi:hypothetical protein